MWEVILPAIISSVIAGIFAGIIAGGRGAASAVTRCMEKYQKTIEDLSKDVEHLKKEKIEKLEVTISEHLSKDKTQGLSVELQNINKSIDNLTGEMTAVGKDVAVLKQMTGIVQRLEDSDMMKTRSIAALESDRKGDRSFIENLNKSIQDHKQAKGAHRG